MLDLTGSFLVARNTLRDPNFLQTVVLVLRHNPGGAFGVVVNRPAKMEGLPFPVFGGGPCQSPGLILLHGHSEWFIPPAQPAKSQVAAGIYLGDVSCFERLGEVAEGKTLRYRLFAGYSGWGPGQLEGELEVRAWVVVPATGNVLFGTAPEDLWERLLPPTLPEPSMN